MIEFKNVTKEYNKGIVGLNNINLTIEDGEFVFLIGASGAGKSTLTKLMLREITPTSGSIIIDGKNIQRLKNSEVPYFRRNIGFVFQDFRLLSDRTAFENVAFALEAIGIGKSEVERRVYNALSQVGLRDRAHHFPGELSGGEQQRVALARAIVNHPKILVADEPTGNLDVDTAKEIMEILYEINRRGTTVFMATHDRGIVEKSHHRILTLSNGSLVGDDNLQGGYNLGRSDVQRKQAESIQEKVIDRSMISEEMPRNEENILKNTLVQEQSEFAPEHTEKIAEKKERKNGFRNLFSSARENKGAISDLVEDMPNDVNNKQTTIISDGEKVEEKFETMLHETTQMSPRSITVQKESAKTVVGNITLAGSKAGINQDISELERKVLEAFYAEN